MPELRKSRDRVWEVATIVPTDRPIHALAAVLLPLIETDMSEIIRLRETNQLAEDLLSRKTALRDIVDLVLKKQPGTDRLLLIADQWEELFTLCTDEAARRCFIDNILEATEKVKLSVVLTLRGDFFGRAITDYRPLSDRVQGAQVNLGPMNREELRLAIQEPAQKVGLTFEAGLVDRMLEQAGDEPGQLPLLEFVLRRLWEDRRGGELHHEAYKAMGQLEGAIAKKAESLYEQASKEDQRRIQQIFLRLVRPGEGDEAGTRRRATFGEVGEAFRNLVKTLADERLLVTSQLAGSAEETIEVSHEKLIRHWERLKNWVKDDRDLLAWQQRLNAEVKEWEGNKRSSDLLLRGLPLSEALDRLKKKPEYFSPGEREFVTASLRRRNYQRWGAAIVAGLVLMIIVGMNWLWHKGYSLSQAGLKVQSVFGRSIHQIPKMQPVSAGTFRQGDTHDLGNEAEQPVHEVRVKAFAIGEFEVSFEEYDRFAIARDRELPNTQGWGRGKQPVINVSWREARDYADWLSRQTGQRYRLPTESEWEYAARSGGQDAIWAGTSDEEQLKMYAVYAANSQNRTAPVGADEERKPNAIGLYDMSGNVYEWVEDCAHNNYDAAPTDGSAWLEANGALCQGRVLRGGSWYNRPETLRVSSRSRGSADYRSSSVGFRLAQDIP